MAPPESASALLRSLDLLPDGPVLWGQPVRSRKAGIFIVEIPARETVAPIDIVAVRAWVERVPGLRLDGEPPTPTGLADRLGAFWLPGQTVLYVGRTAKSLGARVAAMVQTPLGDRRPFAAGHWLKTLRDVPKLRIWWAETDAPEEYEDAVATAVAEAAGPEARALLPDQVVILPWANLESVTGERKATGITGALLSEADAAAAAIAAGARPAAAVKRAPARRPNASRTTGAATRRRSSGGGASKPMPLAAHLTVDGLAGVQRELEELRTVRRPEVILRVKHARELGDLRENADYEAARNEQSFLEGRIQALEHLIKTALVIEHRETGEVTLGSTVVSEVDGEEVVLQIVGSTEADPAAGRISNASPVGKALLGHRVGDVVLIVTPRHEIRYVIREVRASGVG
jgi:transcription elongation factor GreA